MIFYSEKYSIGNDNNELKQNESFYLFLWPCFLLYPLPFTPSTLNSTGHKTLKYLLSHVPTIAARVAQRNGSPPKTGHGEGQEGSQKEMTLSKGIAL